MAEVILELGLGERCLTHARPLIAEVMACALGEGTGPFS